MILILIVMIVLQQLPVELQAVHNMLQKNEHLLMLRSNTTTSLPPTTSGGSTKRHSRASDTSSAYSGSDVTTAVTVDDIDIDLSCLRESSVDSDDDETLDATEVRCSPRRNVYFIFKL